MPFRRLLIALVGAFLFCATASGAPQHSPVAPEDLIPFQGANTLWGYLDRNTRRVVITPQFGDVHLFQGDHAEVSPSSAMVSSLRHPVRLTNWIDPQGHTLFPESFRNVSPVGDDDAEYHGLRQATTRAGLTGILSIPLRHWVVQPQPQSQIRAYAADKFLVGGDFLQDGTHRYSPPAGTRITEVDFDLQLFHIRSAHAGDGLLAEFNHGLADWQGHILVPPRYLSVQVDPETRAVLATRLAAPAHFLARLGLPPELLVVTGWLRPVTDLLDAHGRTLRTFSSRWYVDFSRRPGVGAYAEDKASSGSGRHYFSLLTGKDIPALEVHPHTGPWVFREGGRYGVKQADGAVLIPARYDDLQFFGKHHLVATRAQHAGVIDLAGRTIVPLQYARISDDGLGRFLAWDNVQDRSGVFDREGRLVIPFRHRNNNLVFFPDGYAQVHQDGQYGVIDARGATVIPMQYRTLIASDTPGGRGATYFAAENQEGHWGLLAPDGREAVPFDYGYVSLNKRAFKHGWVHVESLDRQRNGLVNIRTGVRLPPRYGGVDLEDGFILVASRPPPNSPAQWRMLDLQGQPLTDAPYNDMEVIQQHFVMVTTPALRMGVLDDHGQVRIPPRYLHLWDEGHGFVRAERAPHRYVYVDFHGTEYRPAP